MIIGITGNSGSGKTSISRLLGTVPSGHFAQSGTDLNAEIIDADKVVKEICVPGEDYFEEIVREFGRDILLDSGEINKKKFANVIFTDDKKRNAIDLLTFKYVVEEIKKRANLSKSQNVIIDAPLLIESGLNKICDIVISVIADESIKIKRICKRDNIEEKTAKERINAQAKNDFYIKNSNLVIVNNDDCDLEKQVRDIKEIIESKIINNPEIVIIKEKDLKLIQFKKLLEYSETLSHCFTIKHFDFGSNDTYMQKKEEADNNYKSVCKLLNLDSKNIIRPYQTHTNNVKEVNDEARNF